MIKNKIQRAYEILDTYDVQNAPNPYVKMIKRQYDRGNKVLNDFEVDYIINNHDFKPNDVNRVVKITKELGERLFEKHNLEFVPEKIRIGRVIGEMGDSIHCYIQYRQSVPPFLAFVSRKGILDSVEKVDWKNYEVDFEPFDEKLSKLNPPRKLKQHQKEAVQFLCANKKAILADGMGLGKTTSSLVASLVACPNDEDKILVITTASLKTNWKREALMYLPEEEVSVINGSDWNDCKKVTIINYDIAQRFYTVAEEPVYEEVEVKDNFGNVIEKLKKPVMVKNKSTGRMEPKMKKSRNKEEIAEALKNSPLFLNKFKCVVIDEAHKLSNNKSIRYKTISDFLKKSKPDYIYLLTGTPLTNRPDSFYHVLNLINAEVCRDYNYFMTRFCSMREMQKRDGSIIKINGEPSHLDELREKVKDVYIRRLASEIGDMVDKTVETVYYDLTPEERTEYNKLWDMYLRGLEGEDVSVGEEYDDYFIEDSTQSKADEKEKYRQLIECGLVRQFLARCMVPRTIEFVDSLIEDGEKVLIMTCYTKELEAFKKYYGDKCVTYKGGMTTKQKDAAQEAFLNDPKKMVFVGNIAAASVGLNLQSARYVVFNSFSWVMAENLQSADRVYRLTQTRSVSILYEVFNDSISLDMLEKVLLKGQISDEIIKSEKEKK